MLFVTAVLSITLIVEKPVKSYSVDKFIKTSRRWEKAKEAVEFYYRYARLFTPSVNYWRICNFYFHAD